MTDSSTSEVTRSGFVAVAGRPNAGKSSLVNALVRDHVAIVSPIAQTTRRVVRGALTTGSTQLVFIDLPGSQQPVDRLTERMQGAVERSLKDVDGVLWVVDALDEPRAGERKVADMVFAQRAPVIVAANKIDRMRPHQIAQRLEQLSALIGEREYQAIVPISATTGSGLDALVGELVALMPECPAYFPPDTPTDMTLEERVSEYVREAALHFLRDELPHASIVEVEEMTRSDDGTVAIDCVVWVERESQVGIVVGARGATIKQIGIRARQAIEQTLEDHVFLQLRVKVRKRWRDDDAQLERWGL